MFSGSFEEDEGHLSIEPNTKKLKGYRNGEKKNREKKHKRTDDKEINREKRKKHKEKAEEWNDVTYGEKEEDKNKEGSYKIRIIYLLNRLHGIL